MEAVETNLAGLTKAQLLEKAKELGLQIDERERKGVILEAVCNAMGPDPAGVQQAQPVPVGPVRYLVKRACTDFEGRYREAGEIVDVPAGVPVPKWFEPLSGVPHSPTAPPAEPTTLSELTKQLAKDLEIPAGK